MVAQTQISNASGQRTFPASRSLLSLAVALALAQIPAAQAGDILRGGASAGPTTNAPTATSGVTTALANKAQANAADSLARTAAALQSIRAMQTAARKVALTGPNNLGPKLPRVANGLVIGGLVPDTGLQSPAVADPTINWNGATTPIQLKAGGTTRVNIVQTQSQALLNWQTFNVGKRTQVTFDQRLGGKNASQWIAFNKINDPSGNPTQILGSIDAVGQVYLVNQNGIIFGGSSQINLHNLTASTLPINDGLIERGLLNNPDKQFLFSALTVPALTNNATQPAFTPSPSNLPNGKIGDIVVQRGAQITAPTTESNVGGRIALIGANVTNEGTLATPDGQTILAAGLQVGFAAHASNDATLRGLDVSVGQVTDPASSLPAYAGTAINNGLIDAPRANTTIAGKNVQQNGVIHSTTTVSLNGRIDLLANYNAAVQVIVGKVFLTPTATGNVTLGPGSVSDIFPELDSSEKAVGQKLALNSQVVIQGRNIHLANDAQIFAPSANVTLDTGSWINDNGTSFVHDQGQIYFDSGAGIDVAGTTAVDVAISNYIIEAQVRGAEVADAPLQRQGPFRGQTIFLDSRRSITYNGRTWVGTALADASGYVGLIQHNVGELTTSGGTVSLKAGGSVVLQNQSKIDVSGGWKNVLGGQVQTTRVLVGGQLLDIADATPDRVYDGFYTGTFTQNFQKYGIANTFSHALKLDGAHYEPGYLEGAPSGIISIAAPIQILDGELLGQSLQGPRQRSDTSLSGTLNLAFRNQSTGLGFPNLYPSQPTVTFRPAISQTRVAAFALDADGNAASLNEDRAKNVSLDPALLGENAFGHLTLENNDGEVIIPQGTTLQAPAGGSLTIGGSNISVAGTVQAPGGSLKFVTHNILQSVVNDVTSSPDTAILPLANPDRGLFRLAGGGSLSTAGLLVDERVELSPLPIAIAGGSISVNTFSGQFEAGGDIDVSGGAYIDHRNKITYGDAGQLSLLTGQDSQIGSVTGGFFVNDATLRGYSGAKGGTLALQAVTLQIGGPAPSSAVLQLGANFFNTGGFSQFSLTGLGVTTPDNAPLPALVIIENTNIAPLVQSLRLAPRSVENPDLTLERYVPEENLRNAVSLTFNSAGVRSFGSGLVARGDLIVQSGVSITTNPLSSVVVKGNTVDFHGSISAPGGSIEISGGGNTFSLFGDQSQALATVYLAPESRLSTEGTTQFSDDPYGRRLGQVLAGGSISIAGNIVAAAGAILEVSGAADTLDFAPAKARPLENFSISARSGINRPLASLQTVAERVESNAGSITFAGSQLLYSDATLLGRSGGASAAGGNLSISSNRFQVNGVVSAFSPNLEVQQSGPTLAIGFDPKGGVIGQPVEEPGATDATRVGHFAADDFLRGGFGSLELKGNVKFTGPIQLHAAGSLNVGSGGLIYSDATTSLSAAYVALGQAFQTPALPEDHISPFFPLSLRPTAGSGRLFVRAELIDIGNLSLQGIGDTRFNATNGDIRGDGTFQSAGRLSLTAGQIYPVTAASFSIITYDTADQAGTITISPSGTRPLPYSAGGTLGIYASHIVQNGSLRAPQGSIQLGWNGTGPAPIDLLAGNSVPFPITTNLELGRLSVTSVSAIDPVTGLTRILPYGLVENGTSWIDPRGLGISLTGPPQKTINLSAQNIQLASGAQVDLRGGGDLSAYTWFKGNGGTIDVLETTGSFAIIPDFEAEYAPYAPFNTSTKPANLLSGAGLGYTNDALRAGDRIYLAGSSSLAAGYYTLLPARYALLEGAVLVTPTTNSPTGSISLPVGSNLVSGYRLNTLDRSQATSNIATQFEVAPSEVVRSRSQFSDYFATDFFKANAAKTGLTTPRLPVDGGQLVFQATASLPLQGRVFTQAGTGGRGGIVDISSPNDILIGNKNTDTAGKLILDSAELNQFGAESLLVGGIRTLTGDGTKITTNTANLTVDNAGTPVSLPDLILSATDNLTFAPNSEILASAGTFETPDLLLINGNGLLVRITSVPDVTIARSGITTASQALLTIGSGVRLAGGSITLGSSSGTSLASNARLIAQSIYLNSGRISLLLDQPGTIQPTTGLVLSGTALKSLQNARCLSLLSYSSIDIYGTGTVGTDLLASLALHSGEIRGFNNDGGQVTFRAQQISLDNSSQSTVPGAIAPASGTLRFESSVLHLGDGALAIDQYANIELIGRNGILFDGTGNLVTSGNLTLQTPLVTGASREIYNLASQNGDLAINRSSGNVQITPGLGARLTLQGRNVSLDSSLLLPSGNVLLHAVVGNVSIGGEIDVSGAARTFFDVIKTSAGGQIQLLSDTGDVSLTSNALIDVSANSLGGNAGRLFIQAAQGDLRIEGRIRGLAAGDGKDGSFLLDIASLDASTYSLLQNKLQTGGFTESQTFRIRNGDLLLNGLSLAHQFDFSTDNGSITVAGTIDASGTTGGGISLQATGSLTLLDGSGLTAAAQQFDHAGKGGSIYLAAGSERNGAFDSTAILDLQTGSKINLSVAANQANSASDFGRFTGTLHLRAPQNVPSTDLALAAIQADITGASSILIEGYKIFDLTTTADPAGTITTATQASVLNNGNTFLGANGMTTANYTAMSNRVLGILPSDVAAIAHFAPGAEIINRTGNLTLGTTNSTATSDWNLSTYRFGPKSSPGVLTLRAADNLVFYNALSDGFLINNSRQLYQHLPLNQTTLLPANSQSWTYHLTAGADFSAGSFRNVVPLSALSPTAGNLSLGKNNGTNSSTTNTGPEATTGTALTNRYQVIRTGSGDIEINTARSIQLLNQFATIYTAGTLVKDATLGGLFNNPSLRQVIDELGDLGSPQQSPTYSARYTMAGGNVFLNAGQNIEHLTLSNGVLVPDSQRELPNNWLYRRGYVDPVTGQFGQGNVGLIASTTWWIDFSNFFEGIGALGGGNVTLNAGENISNVDAVVPTNMRLTNRGLAKNATAYELGGGDLNLNAGANIDGGVYYVEKGIGTLNAGGSITTNRTRSPSLTNLVNPGEYYDSSTWLPTTLFLGKGSFDITAQNDVLLGPVANPFLLPGGFSNTFWFKTYFSTYASDSSVTVNSVGGTVTLRESITRPGGTSQTEALPIHFVWLNNISLLKTAPATASFYQPWLRLDETSVTPFTTAVSLLPPTLEVTSFSSDINLVGNLTLFPSATGNLELFAAGGINGLLKNGLVTEAGVNINTYGTSYINVSDTNPTNIPGIYNPFAYQSIAGASASMNNTTGLDFLLGFDAFFAETGATQGEKSVLQVRQSLHSPDLLHRNDKSPVRIYASTGDISGIGLYSPKETKIFAGRDILDIAFYLQNLTIGDTSVVSSGRDLIPYNTSSILRNEANTIGNIPNIGAGPLAGDIQIAGPGSLEVLAGRNLDLGVGATADDGTGAGIASIGNARNPYLAFEGANLFIGAGLGQAPDFLGFGDLGGSSLGLTAFIDKYLSPNAPQSTLYLTELGLTANQLASLDEETKRQIAIQTFYLILRDAGRNSGIPGSPDYQTYASGFEAIATLFPGRNWQGDISLTSRQIKTTNGGNLAIFAPGGKLTVGFDVVGDQPLDQGILTQAGGNISIFTDQSVTLGTSRIFTLRGGNEIIWSSNGDIASGAASKTVQSAPPTRVLVDPQSGDLQTDLAGLATGGGIGVLATVKNVPPGNVDLIAPTGTVDAGDAGIRSSGNVSIAAVQVLNADNIQVAGTSVGIPTVVAPTVNLAGITQANATSGASPQAANDVARQNQQPVNEEQTPSIIIVEVLGYGG